jgi:hypothetical protein
MLAKFRPRSAYDVMAALALFLALSTGAAYAANTVFSTDIVDGEVKTPDLANGAVGQGKLGANSVITGKVVDDSLGGADILESSLAKVPNADKLDGIDSTGFVHGRGTLLSNRIVFLPTTSKSLLQIPGLGTLEADCINPAAIVWLNTTSSTIDLWVVDSSGAWSTHLVPPQSAQGLVNSDTAALATLGLGLGNDPGPRRIATLHVFALQNGNGAPCGFQAQGTLWVSP